MLTITSRLPSANLKISKALPQLIQGYIYRYLPSAEHEGYRHEPSGKIFKRTNFDFRLNGSKLRIRFTSYEPEFEKTIALAVLKDGLNLGELCLCDTTVAVSEHRTAQSEAGLGHKIYLQPQDSRHLEMMKINALQRFETLTGRRYEGEFELNLLWQNLQNPFNFYYGNNRSPIQAWQAKWKICAQPELINLILDVGIGSGCMNCGAGFMEIAKEKQVK